MSAEDTVAQQAAAPTTAAPEPAPVAAPQPAQAGSQAGQPQIPSQAVPGNDQNLPQGIPNPQQTAQKERTPSPMLSHVSQEAAAKEAGQQAQPEPPPGEPEPRQERKADPARVSESTADLVGDLVSDTYAKPAITYIDSICSDAGVDMQRAFGKAVEFGDSRLIDQAYLSEKLGNRADSVAQQAAALFEYSASKASEATKAVYEAAGGEAVLRQAVQHFNQAASPEERAEIAYLLDSGNTTLMKRAAKRIAQYGQQAGAVYSPQGQPTGKPSAAQGLSREAYIEALSKPRLSPSEYERLREQRVLGKAQGM